MSAPVLARWIRVGVILAGAVLMAWPVGAEDLSFSCPPEFALPHAPMAAFDSRPAMLEQSGGVVGQEWCDAEPMSYEPCHSPGPTGGADIAFLTVHESQGYLPGDDYKTAWRAWLGWTLTSGLGLRVRWLDLDARRSAPPGDQAPALGLSTLDLELTDFFRPNTEWDGTISAGVRYGECEQQVAAIGNRGLHGLGPVAGLQVNRNLTERLSLFGLGRVAILFGDYREVRPAGRQLDTVHAVPELQLGGQWRRLLCGTSHAFVRAAWETQFWSEVSGANASGPGVIAFGLIGGTLAIGIDR